MALIFLSGYFYLNIKRNNDINNQIITLDKYIDNKEYIKAEKLLLQISKKLPDRYSCYRVIKRSMALSELKNDFSIFLEVSKNSSETFPGNEDIQAYYVMALLKNEQYSVANKVASDNLVSIEFKPLLAQTIIFLENKDNKYSTITDYIRSKEDPAFYEYLANLLNEPELFINAALLWAKQGEIEKSYSLLKSYNKRTDEQLLALLAYDSGRESEALIRLLELPESDSIKYNNLLLIADLLYLKDNFSRSRYYYEKAIEVNKINASPYINISSIYLKNDSIKKALSFLENGITNISDNIEIKSHTLEELVENKSSLTTKEEIDISNELQKKLKNELKYSQLEYRELILLLYHLNKEISSSNSIKIIEDYRRLFPNDVKVELLYMREKQDVIHPDIYIANLWKLLNKDIDNREVSEFLVWYLLGVKNYNDIDLVLTRSKNRYPEDNWTIYYRAILKSLNGEYSEALDLFNSENIDIDQWEILYNKGVVQMALLNYPEALINLNKSIISINQKKFLNNKDVYLSKINTKLAQVLIYLNDIDEAIRVLNKAFELDPNNYTSDLLKSIHTDLKDKN